MHPTTDRDGNTVPIIMDAITHAAPHATPYANLTPDCVLDALESCGLQVDGRMLALNSYENRVFQVGIDRDDRAHRDSFVVAKFYRPHRWSDAQILEEHSFARELIEQEIPVVAPLEIAGQTLHAHAGFRFAVFPRRGGRTPELERADVLHWIGRFLGRIHAVGARAPFVHRPTLNIDTFGVASRDFLLQGNFVPDDLRAVWQSVIDQALEETQRGFERVGPVASLRLHGDCHAGNVLWTPDGPHFVDLDDARNGPAVQDLWMLLSGDASTMQIQLAHVLEGYRMFHTLNTDECALIEPLRTLRLIHYAAWLARRWQDPAFPAAFPWFGTTRYWQERIQELREQIALMQEA